ncbi:methionyl-tRNA formyltransferase [Candidatus Falkowbacteria bacterium]|uniref:Methionyl-tRNA formyltransferase n=1 Tax=Candidatus Buchananbacteria bacterium CG10_big_fil_rev_8_21_14_0_10_33_19 TaxID=1974525 RepID=A0A2H0W3N1_9BACT|nr:methionyl-tRNA formyltransferase [Candidatus Falkowbacteria bacterium]PIS05956.1 MAG: methionyl-tRNA formyltransferase [Candidatus Buchananbacteria bacterium CG10_big_fil_rev_8_21_14_0_10_33_19]
MKAPSKIIFMGTPEFAVPYLKSLLNNDFEIVGIITQPDKPTGRKQIISIPPVKAVAIQNNIRIFQSEKLKTDTKIIEELKSLEPDLTVVVAYGQIIPQAILNIAKLGNINVHPSLLPKYRGASPIQNAILNGETKTGITIMLMDAKMDHGPILAQKELLLAGNEDNESLHKIMSDNSSTNFLIETIKKFISNQIAPTIQNDEQATYCQLISKEEAKINWHKSAQIISNQIRAFYPWPTAWTTLSKKRVKIFPPVNITDGHTLAGKIIINNDKFLIGCNDQLLEISELQIEGKNKIKAKDFILGNKDIIDQSFE